MMKNVLGAALLGCALATATAAPASAYTTADLGLSSDGIGGFVTTVATYDVFETIFKSIYAGGVGYGDLVNAFGLTASVAPVKTAFVAEGGFAFDGWAMFYGGASNIVQLQLTDYTGSTADAHNYTYPTPGPVAGAGLPLVLGAFAWGMRRRARAEAKAA